MSMLAKRILQLWEAVPDPPAGPPTDEQMVAMFENLLQFVETVTTLAEAELAMESKQEA